MVSNFVGFHHVEQLHLVEQLLEVAVDKFEHFPMDSKLVVEIVVAVHNFHKYITIT